MSHTYSIVSGMHAPLNRISAKLEVPRHQENPCITFACEIEGRQYHNNQRCANAVIIYIYVLCCVQTQCGVIISRLTGVHCNTDRRIGKY